jgi:hypothetical protein
VTSPTPSFDSQVRINDDVLFQELTGQGVLLNLKSGVYIGLDQVGTRVWTLLETHSLLSEIHNSLVAEFDVTPERCTEDLLALVDDMQKQGLVTVTTPHPG